MQLFVVEHTAAYSLATHPEIAIYTFSTAAGSATAFAPDSVLVKALLVLAFQPRPFLAQSGNWPER